MGRADFPKNLNGEASQWSMVRLYKVLADSTMKCWEFTGI